MRKIILSIILLLFSCKKDPELFKIENLNQNEISAFGHAGMGIGFKFPIDSYESIEPCLRIGSDGTEIDVQLTKDSVLVAYHHSTLEDGTLCNGIINDKLWSEISSCNLASPISSKIELDSFDELVIKLKNSGHDIEKYVFTFDCKLYSSASNKTAYYEQFANALVKKINDYHLYNNLFIESNDSTFLRTLQNKQTDLKLFIYPKSYEHGMAVAQKMNLFGITIHNDHITSSQIKEAHEKGFRVALWGTHTDQDNINAIYKSPDYIQTDRIIHLLKVFEKYKE